MYKGFVFIPLLIGLMLVAAVGGGYFYLSGNKNTTNQSSSEISPSILPSATPEPTLTPTFTPTPSPKPTPTKKPFTPTPKPTAAQSACSQFVPENGLTTITINLKEKAGATLTGDWIVKIKPTGSCPGILPPNWGGQINEVIHQPNYTYTSPGLHPGQFRVDVQYHFTGEGFDWDGTSGSHSREVMVSN